MTVALCDVVKAASVYFNLTPQELRGETRAFRISHPRQTVMAAATRLTGRSAKDVGAHFGKDHTTVLHAIRALNEQVDRERDFGAIAELSHQHCTARRARERAWVTEALALGQIIPAPQQAEVA